MSGAAPSAIPKGAARGFLPSVGGGDLGKLGMEGRPNDNSEGGLRFFLALTAAAPTLADGVLIEGRLGVVVDVVAAFFGFSSTTSRVYDVLFVDAAVDFA